MLMDDIDEVKADFVLSTVKNGLYDLVTSVEMDESKEKIIANLQPDIIEKFSNKFPEAELGELDTIVSWILMTAILRQKDTADGIVN